MIIYLTPSRLWKHNFQKVNVFSFSLLINKGLPKCSISFVLCEDKGGNSQWLIWKRLLYLSSEG